MKYFELSSCKKHESNSYCLSHIVLLISLSLLTVKKDKERCIFKEKFSSSFFVFTVPTASEVMTVYHMTILMIIVTVNNC